MAPKKALPRKAKAPTQPPGGADFSALVKKVNELASKVPGVTPLNATITGKIPAWKRWVGGEGPDYDVTGLRDIVATNAIFTNEVKSDVDSHGQALLEIRQDIRELQEAAPSTSFP